MNATHKACIMRVRLLATRGMEAAGGRAEAWRVLRALEPVLGRSLVMACDLPRPPGAAAERPLLHLADPGALPPGSPAAALRPLYSLGSTVDRGRAAAK